MWVAFFAFALAVAAMIFLSPKVSVENAKPAKFGDLQIPRSNYGDPISLLFGTERQKSPVVLWYGDFSTVAITETIDGGLFHSDKSYVTGHKYYLGFDLALCLGPGVVLKRIFSDTDIIWEGSKSADGDITIDQENLFGGDKSGGGLKGTATFYTGSFDTARDPYLAIKVDENIPSYNGICRIVFKNFYIGTAATLPSISFEISRLTSGLDSTYSIMPNGVDLNPIEIAYDALTRNFGCFGNSPDLLDLPSFISSAQILYDENIQMSILIQSSITGEDLINEVMTQCDGLMYQDPATSKIVCKLIREDYDIEDLITLDESSIKSLTNFAKSTWNDTFNQVRVTFSNRDDDYDDSVAVAQDFANINFQDRVKSTEISAVGCKTSSTALIMASKQLSFVSVPLYKCDIICNRKAQSLRPGGCFILNWSPFSLTNMVMRISKISLGELANNEITITCIQDKFSTSTPIFAQPDVSHFVPINSEPAPVVYTSIFTPPLFLSSNSSTETVSSFDNSGRLYSVAKKPTGASFLYDVMLSSDNFVSNLVLGNESVIYNSTGKLLNDYPNTVAFSTKHDTSGDLIIYDMSNEDISNLKQFTTLDQARRGQALILIGSELFIYVGYSNNGDGSVTFNNVYRSIYDTTSYSHLANARAWFIEGINGLINTLIPNSELKYIKLLDTTYSNKLTLDEATLITATQSGRAGLPLPTNYLTINGSRNPSPIAGGTSVTVGWRNRDRNNLSLQVYDEIGSSREPGTQTRIRWRVGAGEYTTITTTSSTVSLDITGRVGILEVIADQQIISNSKYSAVAETITCELESGEYLWTPVEITTSLWLDADDASTITIDTGVSEWRDKSGNARYARQSLDTAQPVINTGGIDGKNSVSLDTTSKSLLISSPGLTVQTLFYVFKTSDANYATFTAASGSVTYALAGMSGNTNYPVNGNFGSPSYLVDGESVTWSTRDSLYLSLNNRVSIVEVINCNFTAFSNILIGGYLNYELVAEFAEILCVPGTPTTEDRQKIEGYLAWKWGLEANLPVDHPYKSSAPIN